jgi:hypothetical protein
MSIRQVHLQRCFLLAGVYAVENAGICLWKRGSSFLTAKRQREYCKEDIYHRLSGSFHLIFIEYP